VASNIIEKSGAWFAYNGEKIGQGRDNSREFLRENPELATEIENKVRAHLGVPLIVDAAPTQNAPVDFRVQSFYAAVHHFRKTGVV
jgi:recombination protein RecA